MENNTHKKALRNLIDEQAIPPFVYTYPPRSSYRPLNERWAMEGIWEQRSTEPNCLC